jgi:hypothetical protein
LYLGPEAGVEATAAFFDRMQEKDFLGFKNVAVDQSAFRVPDLWPRGIVRALGMMKNVEREIVVRKVGKKWRHESRSKYHLKLGRMMLVRYGQVSPKLRMHTGLAFIKDRGINGKTCRRGR